MNLKKNKQKIIAKIRHEVPLNPGVYLFYDEKGKLIYIGKSINLKQRMLSYFRKNLSGMEPRIQQMIFHIQGFDFYETESELSALLLEDELIKKKQPYFNIRQQEFPQYRYLLLTDDRFPTCRMIDHCEDFGSQNVYGPFRDRYFAADILEIIQRDFNLRACEEPHPVGKSLYYEFGYCRGPCRKKITRREYSEIVEQVVQFLNGDETFVLQKLNRAMAEAAVAQNFEQAAQLKNKITFCKNFCTRQRFINQFKSRNLIIQETGARHLIYIFKRGNLKRSNGTGGLPLDFLHNNSGQKQDVRFLLDRANIVYKWLIKEKNYCQFYFE